MTWWWTIVPAMAAQAAIVAGLVWIVVRAGARWPAPLRQALLLIALVKFVVPPIVSAPFSVFALSPAVGAAPAPGPEEIGAGPRTKTKTKPHS